MLPIVYVFGTTFSKNTSNMRCSNPCDGLWCITGPHVECNTDRLRSHFRFLKSILSTHPYPLIADLKWTDGDIQTWFNQVEIKKRSKKIITPTGHPPPLSYIRVPFEVLHVIINDAFCEPPLSTMHSATRATLAVFHISEVMGEEAVPGFSIPAPYISLLPMVHLNKLPTPNFDLDHLLRELGFAVCKGMVGGRQARTLLRSPQPSGPRCATHMAQHGHALQSERRGTRPKRKRESRLDR